MIEGRIAAHQGHHSADAGRVLGVLHIQFRIARALAVVAIRAHIIGTLDGDRSHHRDQLFEAHLVKPRLAAAGTRDFPFEVGRRNEQLFQDLGREVMRRGAGGRLSRLHVEVAALAQAGEDDIQQRRYFLGRLALDRFGRFFSSGVRVSSTDRARQIVSLISSNS
jgi:hypothetical protein